MSEEEREQNSGRLRLRITAEGIAFLVILVFVAVGAVLRSVNLLILLGGMMIAPLLLNWRSQIHVMNNLLCWRHVPRYIHAGALTAIQWECENIGSRLNAWNIVIADTARNITETDASRKRNKRGIRAQVVFPEIEVKRSGFVSYRAFFEQRGTYEFGPADVSTTFPFGLMRSRRKLPHVETVIVAPELGRLSHTWDRRLESIALGSEANRRRRGFEEDEFYALRKWRSGDSRRQIHWRSTAKYGTPMIRQHDQKTNRDLAIVVDLRVGDSKHDLRHCEIALSFAATVFAGLGTDVQGQIVLGICGEQNQVITERYHPETIVQIMRCLGTTRIGTFQAMETRSSSARGDVAASDVDRGNVDVDPNALNPNALDPSALDPSALDPSEPTDPPAAIDPLPEAVLSAAGCVSAGTPVFVVSPRSEKQATAAWPVNQPRLAGILGAMHWLQVDSPEFAAIFEPSSPDEQQRVNALREKWMTDVTG